MDRFRVTVLVALYRAGLYLESKLQSLQQQTMFNDAQIVILNCQNQDDEQSLYSSFNTKHKNVLIIEYDDYRKLYSTWNDGIMATDSEFIVNSNVDDQWRPDFLEKTIKALDESPEYDVVAGQAYVTDRINSLWPDWTWYGQLTIGYPGSTVGPCPLYRRNLHHKFGLYKDRYVSADALMWHKWHLGGVKFLVLDEHLTLYYQGSNLEMRIDSVTGKRLLDLDLEEDRRESGVGK